MARNRRAAVTPFLSVLLALLALSSTRAAAAHDPPGGESVTCLVEAGRLTVLREADGQPVVAPGPTIIAASTDTLPPQVRFRAHDDGFDLLLTYTNDGAAPRDPAAVRLGSLVLDAPFTWHDFTSDGKPETVEAEALVRTETYPGELYSPVAVVRDERVAIGIAVHYPVVEYEHDVRIVLRPVRRAGGGEDLVFMIHLGAASARAGGVSFANPNSIAPGATREYTVSLRVSRPERWITTLLPYRDYFHAQYGGVRYERDPRPVRGIMLAQPERIRHDNPYGFTDTAKRPDRNGWAACGHVLKGTFKSSPRVMLWAPTGVYKLYQNLNFPFRFTTHWLDEGHAMGDAVEVFTQVAPAGAELGLWWGRSCQVMSGWDNKHVAKLDPSNEAHVQAAFAELDLAAQAGATLIGLDAFAHHHARYWDLFDWLGRMRERHPGIRFVTEGRSPDILHVLAPTWLDAYVAPRADRPSPVHIRTPLVLADLLLPGHETWAGMAFHRVEKATGQQVNLQLRRHEARRIADLGYVPVLFQDLRLPGRVEAARSWETTLEGIPGPPR